MSALYPRPEERGFAAEGSLVKATSENTLDSGYEVEISDAVYDTAYGNTHEKE